MPETHLFPTQSLENRSIVFSIGSHIFCPQASPPAFIVCTFSSYVSGNKKTGISENIRNPCFVYRLDSIGVSPNFLLVRCGNEFIPEIRMCQRNEQFRSFPCASACQIHNAVFCYDIESLCSGRCDDVPLCKLGQDSGFEIASLIPIRRCHADKAFPARRVISPCGKKNRAKHP